MEKKKISNLILYIFKKADEEKILIGRTVLVKLIYLLDVEFYRTNRSLYTGLEWIFFKYGPYAFGNSRGSGLE